MIKAIQNIATIPLAAIFVLIALPVYLVAGVVGSIIVLFKSIFDSPWG